MNFVNLQYFLVVARELNITAAARQIHISQQALSQQIQNLETELDTKLFERVPRLQLTPAGVCLANAATRILDIKESASSAIQSMNKNRPGKLKLGISYARAEALLPNILPKYYNDNPNVSIELFEGSGDVIQSELDLGNLDLILVVKTNYPNFIQVNLISENLYIIMDYALLHKFYGSRTDALIEHLRNGFDFSYLRNMPLIMLHKPSTIRSIFDQYLAEKEIMPHILLETRSVQTALELAKSGIGVTLYPDLFFSQSSQRFLNSNILYFPIGPYYPLTACYNPKYPLTAEAGAFLNYLQHYLHDVQRSQPAHALSEQ